MKKKITRSLAALACLLVLSSWGSWGHYHINKAAVFALPDSMRTFFYNHVDYITEESVIPDLRKYLIADKLEGGRHYVDIEAFDKPIDSLRLYADGVAAGYDDKFLQKNGTLPWVIQDVMDRLTKAFQEQKRTEILYLAANLGHYVADAHMPLHTSLNHDGQMTNQKGIHAFWESQLPELFGDSYNFNTGNATYIADVNAETWRIIKNSHNLVDTLLRVERDLSSVFPKDSIYLHDKLGNLVKNKFKQTIHSTEYARQYHFLLRGMVENQMRGAIAAIANYWYTAWVNAGKPDLSALDSADLTKQNKDNYLKEFKAWQKGQLLNMKPINEF